MWLWEEGGPEGVALVVRSLASMLSPVAEEGGPEGVASYS